jgi:hypothetical protein
MIREHVLVLLFFFASINIRAQAPGGSLPAELKGGVRVQKAQKLYWENGFTLDYASPKLVNRKVHLGVSYVSSRLGSAMGSNAIKQDQFFISGAYHFRNQKKLQPFARLNTGVFHADYEKEIFDDLPNNAFLLSLDGGLYYNFNAPVTAGVSAGYNFSSGSGSSGPGTLYPVFYQMSIYYTLSKKQTK